VSSRSKNQTNLGCRCVMIRSDAVDERCRKLGAATKRLSLNAT
jgi:hypothetical protein